VNQLIRLLIVDDSAFVRKVVRQILSRSPFIDIVGTARDGDEALELVEQLQPDVVTLDLHMPHSDGLSFLKKQMAKKPIPVLILSAASESGELVMHALEAGAIDVVQKPTALASDKVFEIADELVAKVKAVAAARIPVPRTRAELLSVTVPAPTRACKTDVVVIGISTGGPQALKRLIPQLPKDFPVPVLIVLHMPVGYTELFARSLNEAARLVVVEAHDGELLQPGYAFLAPAGHHLTLVRRPHGEVVTKLSLRPLDSIHRPSVDVLFRSAADVYGDRVLGVVMTGMGADGTQGASWIKAQGGRIFSEAEESCVVYGMPRSVTEAGLSDQTVALENMADAIIGAL
jgi:two-component system chemotaxis response regulator CheB